MHSDVITRSLGVHCGVGRVAGESSPQTTIMVYAILQYSTFYLVVMLTPRYLRGAAAAGGVTSLKGYFSSSSLRM